MSNNFVHIKGNYKSAIINVNEISRVVTDSSQGNVILITYIDGTNDVFSFLTRSCVTSTVDRIFKTIQQCENDVSFSNISSISISKGNENNEK